MSKYVLIFVWLAFAAMLAYSGRFERMEVVGGSLEVRFKPWFAFLIFVPIIWMAVTRGYFADTTAYLGTFRSMPSAAGEIVSYYRSLSKDKSFYLLLCLIKVFISQRDKVMLFIIAALQSIAVVIFFRKYSLNYLLSVFLFVASTDYISWMFNGIRQFLAVCIIILATPLMLERKYLQTILVILIAATFHQSALLMLPFVFIAQGRAWNKKTLVFILLVLIAIIFIGEFTTFLDDTLQGTQYENVVSDYIAWQDDGVNPLRVLVYSVPAIVSFIGRRYIDEAGDPLVNLCTNMSILTAGVYFIGRFTSGIFIGRLPIYTSLYSYILLPWEMENMFSYESRKLLYFAMIGLYLFYYYYQMHISWGIM